MSEEPVVAGARTHCVWVYVCVCGKREGKEKSIL